jgi:hypothetical protein
MIICPPTAEAGRYAASTSRQGTLLFDVGGARALPLAGVLADALGLPVQETGVEAS